MVSLAQCGLKSLGNGLRYCSPLRGGGSRLLPVYTRFLTPYDYGVKELVGLSVDVIGILLATAISGAFYRFYFKYDTKEDRNEVVSTAFLTIGGVGIVAVGLLACTTKTMANVILNDPSLYHFFLIAFASLWFQSLNNMSYSYLKANKQSVKFIILSFIKMVMAIALNISDNKRLSSLTINFGIKYSSPF